MMDRKNGGAVHSAGHAGEILVPRITIGAFFTTAGLGAILESAAGDRRMSRAKMSIRPGGIPAAAEAYGTTTTPNLIIVESDVDADQLFAELAALSEECPPDTKVIVIGHSNDVTLFRELLERGVSDYLVAPLEPIALIAAIARAYPEGAERRLGRVVAFIGARGGAGSSTIAHNVAAVMASSLEADILLADLDLPFGTVGLDFDLDPAEGMAGILQGADRVDEVLLDRVSTRRGERLQVLPAAAGWNHAYDLREGDVERLVETAQSAARYLLLDLPQTWTSWMKKTLQAADEIVITATPDLSSMRNAKLMAEHLLEIRPNDAPPRLVLNQVGMPKRPEIKRTDFAAAVRLEPSACIPFDPQLFGQASNDGRLIAEMAPRSHAAQAFDQLGRLLGGRKENTAANQNLLSFLGRLSGKRRRA
jgi:pilus assembly protein CpaE